MIGVVVVGEEHVEDSPVVVACVPDPTTLTFGATGGSRGGEEEGVPVSPVAPVVVVGAAGGVVVEEVVVVPAVVDVVPVLNPVTSVPVGTSEVFGLGFWVNLISELLGNPVTCWMGTILAPIPTP